MSADPARPESAEPRDPAQAEAPNGSAPESSASSLESLLAQAQAERDQYLELAKRTRADFENYQTRARRDAESHRLYAHQPFVYDLLPVIDNLERAVEAAKLKNEAPGLVEGVQLVLKTLMDVFGKHGVEAIRPAGEPFDPNRHQAVMQEASDKVPPMTVLQTFQAGYQLRERVIRPAQVVVSKAAE
jgi:molecular chaperone GrpE